MEILPHTGTTPSQKNVANPASVDKTRNYLPPVHIFIKVFEKVMDKESEEFAY